MGKEWEGLHLRPSLLFLAKCGRETGPEPGEKRSNISRASSYSQDILEGGEMGRGERGQRYFCSGGLNARA